MNTFGRIRPRFTSVKFLLTRQEGLKWEFGLVLSHLVLCPISILKIFPISESKFRLRLSPGLGPILPGCWVYYVWLTAAAPLSVVTAPHWPMVTVTPEHRMEQNWTISDTKTPEAWDQGKLPNLCWAALVYRMRTTWPGSPCCHQSPCPQVTLALASRPCCHNNAVCLLWTTLYLPGPPSHADTSHS